MPSLPCFVASAWAQGGEVVGSGGRGAGARARAGRVHPEKERRRDIEPRELDFFPIFGVLPRGLLEETERIDRSAESVDLSLSPPDRRRGDAICRTENPASVQLSVEPDIFLAAFPSGPTRAPSGI